jgi:hypothetical protein
MAVRFHIDFERSPPTIEAIARRFHELTDLELAVESIEPGFYSLTAMPFRHDVELTMGSAIDLVVFRASLGYLEWSIARVLHSLGARVPPHVFPAYAGRPWSSLSRLQRWRHR